MSPDVLCSLVEFLLASLEVAFSAGEGVDAGLVLRGRVVEGVGIEGVGGCKRVLGVLAWWGVSTSGCLCCARRRTHCAGASRSLGTWESSAFKRRGSTGLMAEFLSFSCPFHSGKPFISLALALALAAHPPRVK